MTRQRDDHRARERAREDERHPSAPATDPVPTLLRRDPPRTARGLVLMLHGGTPSSAEPVDGRSASWLRSAVMQRAIGGDLAADGVAVWLLRYRRRGWNGGSGPIDDARWALLQARETLGEVPVALLGHSMGARTAVHVADDPRVRGVVALAPWLPPDESVAALAGRRLIAAHGRRDRITSFAQTAAYVERAGRVAASAELVDMGPLGHYLIKGAGRWNDVALRQVRALLP